VSITTVFRQLSPASLTIQELYSKVSLRGVPCKKSGFSTFFAKTREATAERGTENTEKMTVASTNHFVVIQQTRIVVLMNIVTKTI